MSVLLEQVAPGAHRRTPLDTGSTIGDLEHLWIPRSGYLHRELIR
jgi:hypothetical protein